MPKFNPKSQVAKQDFLFADKITPQIGFKLRHDGVSSRHGKPLFTVSPREISILTKKAPMNGVIEYNTKLLPNGLLEIYAKFEDQYSGILWVGEEEVLAKVMQEEGLSDDDVKFIAKEFSKKYGVKINKAYYFSREKTLDLGISHYWLQETNHLSNVLAGDYGHFEIIGNVVYGEPNEGEFARFGMRYEGVEFDVKIWQVGLPVMNPSKADPLISDFTKKMGIRCNATFRRYDITAETDMQSFNKLQSMKPFKLNGFWVCAKVVPAGVRVSFLGEKNNTDVLFYKPTKLGLNESKIEGLLSVPEHLL